MVPERKIYYVTAEQLSLGKRIARALLALVIFIVATYIFNALWRPGKAERFGREDFVVDAVIAAATDFFTKRKGYELEVDDETIRMRGGDWINKSVRRGHIRYLRESSGNWFHEAALKLSEHGPIRTRFLGCVWIPASLPEYEEIKARARSWQLIG
jgi:hypothetical protein